MKAQYITPFLESATNVFQQMCNISPTQGDLEVKDVALYDDHIWLQIGLTGQLKGDIIFGLPKEVALRIVSAMMGGLPIQEIDEISKSAISELGNMISGNASTILFNQGITIDITPPQLLESASHIADMQGKALSVPLDLGNMGKIDIQVMILS